MNFSKESSLLPSAGVEPEIGHGWSRDELLRAKPKVQRLIQVRHQNANEKAQALWHLPLPPPPPLASPVSLHPPPPGRAKSQGISRRSSGCACSATERLSFRVSSVAVYERGAHSIQLPAAISQHTHTAHTYAWCVVGRRSS